MNTDTWEDALLSLSGKAGIQKSRVMEIIGVENTGHVFRDHVVGAVPALQKKIITLWKLWEEWGHTQNDQTFIQAVTLPRSGFGLSVMDMAPFCHYSQILTLITKGGKPEQNSAFNMEEIVFHHEAVRGSI